MPRIFVAVALAVCAGAARADTPPEDAFFTEGAIVAHWHTSGPTKRESVWLRRDGHVLERSDRSRDLPMALDGDGRQTGWTWRSGVVDAALAKKVERLAHNSGVCAARSTQGFSVGGAWTVAVDYGPALRCAFRNRAHLSVDAKLRKLADAVRDLPDAIDKASAMSGVREDAWDLGPLQPMR